MTYEGKLDCVLEILSKENNAIRSDILRPKLNTEISEGELSSLLLKLTSDGNIEHSLNAGYQINMNGRILLENKGYSEAKRRNDELYNNSKLPIRQNKWIIILTILGIIVTISVFIYGLANTKAH